MEIDLALLADAATVDSSGKLNILGVFDRVSASEFPAMHQRICLVLRFTAAMPEAGAHDLGISLTSPSGEQLFSLDGEMTITPSPGAGEEGIRVSQVLNVDGVVFEAAGRYTFDVSIDGDHHVSLALTVSSLGRTAKA